VKKIGISPYDNSIKIFVRKECKQKQISYLCTPTALWAL